jgi:glycerol-3-phosphate dehydrogenase
VQGAHIVVGGRRAHGAYYVEARDRRPVFVLPYGERTLVGTTETVHDGPPHTAQPRADEITYLQETLARYFPTADARVLSSYAGLRVLPRAGGAYGARVRDMMLHVDAAAPRVLSIYGGKLTGYRATAEKVVHRVRRLLPPRTARAETLKLMLI